MHFEALLIVFLVIDLSFFTLERGFFGLLQLGFDFFFFSSEALEFQSTCLKYLISLVILLIPSYIFWVLLKVHVLNLFDVLGLSNLYRYG